MAVDASDLDQDLKTFLTFRNYFVQQDAPAPEPETVALESIEDIFTTPAAHKLFKHFISKTEGRVLFDSYEEILKYEILTKPTDLLIAGRLIIAKYFGSRVVHPLPNGCISRDVKKALLEKAKQSFEPNLFTEVKTPILTMLEQIYYEPFVESGLVKVVVKRISTPANNYQLMPKTTRETKTFVSVGANQVLVDLGKIVVDIQQLEYVNEGTTATITELRKLLDEFAASSSTDVKLK